MKNEIILPVNIAGVNFKNPFYVASGPLTKSVKQLVRIEECGWAAASIKLTIGPAPYINRRPRFAVLNGGDALAFTAERRLSFEEGLRLVADAKKVLRDLILFANITYAGEDGEGGAGSGGAAGDGATGGAAGAGGDSGNSGDNMVAGWVNMAKRFEEAGADIIELNMCCPNMSYNLEITSGDAAASRVRTGASLGQKGGDVAEIVRACKKAVKIPVFVKLTPEGGRIAHVAAEAFAAGADAVGGTANRLGIPPIDLDNPASAIYRLQEEISMSCYSGAWLKPLALRDAYEIRKVCGEAARITATGGVRTAADALEMVMCGADLVGICAEALISGFGFIGGVIEETHRWLSERGTTLRGIRGCLTAEVKTAQELTLYEGYAQIKNPRLAAPCKTACPMHVPAQAYVQKVARGDVEGAYRLIAEKGPMQSVCGYACNHECEQNCTRGEAGAPVRIRDIKRFVLETGKARGYARGECGAQPSGAQPSNAQPSNEQPSDAQPNGGGYVSGDNYASVAYRMTDDNRMPGEHYVPPGGGGYVSGEYCAAQKDARVAVVGGGPAGMANAYFMRKAGYGVTIFEKEAKCGGLPRYAIPRFRLPEAAVDGEVERLTDMGVEIRTGVSLGADFNVGDLGRQGYGAVFLAVGAQSGKKLGISGEDSAGVYDAVDFMKRINAEAHAGARADAGMGAGAAPGNTVVVIGGGFAAVDAARSALRAGAVKVYVAYRRTRGEMPAGEEEIGAAEAEGVKFIYLAAPVRIETRGGNVASIVFNVQSPSERDDSGRRGIEAVPGAEYAVACDAVIVAAGQETPIGLSGSADGSIPVFAGGDATGAGSVIRAAADGYAAAYHMDAMLSGGHPTLAPPPALTEADKEAVLARSGYVGKAVPAAVPPGKINGRAAGFELRTRTMTYEEAVAEAKRCLNCGCGEGCARCVEICGEFAPAVAGPDEIAINKTDCTACGVCYGICPNKNIEMINTGVKI